MVSATPQLMVFVISPNPDSSSYDNVSLIFLSRDILSHLVQKKIIVKFITGIKKNIFKKMD